MPQTRQLAAIMFTDIVDYTSLVGGELHTFELTTKNFQIQKPLTQECRAKGILRSDSRLQSFLHKMKFPG